MMEQYSRLQMFFLRLKWALVWVLRKVLSDSFVDRYIEPLYYRLKRVFIRIRYHVYSLIRLRNQKMVVFISGEWMTPGHTYRVEHYAEAFRNLGLPSTWFKPDDVFVNHAIINKCRLLIIWRTPMSKPLQNVIDKAKAKSIPVIFDIDDYMFNPEMAKAHVIDGIRSMKLETGYVRNLYADLRASLGAADIVTCPTKFLAQKAAEINPKAFVLPNGYTSKLIEETARPIHLRAANDNKIRIGYAGGTRTHQRDFAVVIPALVKVFSEFPDTILTIFGEALLVDEYEELKPWYHRIEQRPMVHIQRMMSEIARFDINIAPLELNEFCQAKSELKFFEAALLQIPTIASPTEPYYSAISNGLNGFTASNNDEWYQLLRQLILSKELRKKIGAAARNQVLWSFGPEERINKTYELLHLLNLDSAAEIRNSEERRNALRFYRKLNSDNSDKKQLRPSVPDFETIRSYSSGKYAAVGVIIPLFNYADFIIQALESVNNQKLKEIDLVIVDDCSTDNSLPIVTSWLEQNHGRFNNSAILKNRINAKLGATRNAGFSFINTQFVMTLDADNELLPACLSICYEQIKNSGAAMVYPQLEIFGDNPQLIKSLYDVQKLGQRPWKPERLAEGNYIDAMALISKAAWWKVGGYDVTYQATGWEDYDLWLKFIEHGLFGINVPKVLAKYRVHEQSMLREAADLSYQTRRNELTTKHPWIREYAFKPVSR